MKREEDVTTCFLESMKKELVSIIGESPEACESNTNREKVAEIKPQDYVDTNAICSTSISDQQGESRHIKELPLKSAVLDSQNINNIETDMQKMLCNLEESHKLFQTIEERFKNINFENLKSRIEDLNLSENSTDPIMTIVNDIKHSFDEKYMENRINDLTKDITSKFRNHPGEFGDIPEISEFFRTCTKLEQEMQKLRKQRDGCMDLQKRMSRVAEASYDRVRDIQEKIIQDDKDKSPEENI